MDYFTGASLSVGVLLILANGKQRQGQAEVMAYIPHAHFPVSVVRQRLDSVVLASVGRV